MFPLDNSTWSSETQQFFGVSICFIFEPMFDCIAQVDLLLQPPECWVHMCKPPCPAQLWCFVHADIQIWSINSTFSHLLLLCTVLNKPNAELETGWAQQTLAPCSPEPLQLCFVSFVSSHPAPFLHRLRCWQACHYIYRRCVIIPLTGSPQSGPYSHSSPKHIKYTSAGKI